MHLSTLNEWLDFLSASYPKEMALGLSRVKKVAARLNLLEKRTPVIIIGGTNGKGSTLTALESIYLAAGYRVGAFLSPMFQVFNDQIHINGGFIEDGPICQAFSQIHAQCGDVQLTPFEYHTLAALLIFQNHPLDLILLEVGLGGRLDAVNIIDADLSIITTIALDHTDRLGSTRAAIAYEKAGIARKNAPLVCGDFDPPGRLREVSESLGAKLYLQGEHFHYQTHPDHWHWQCETTQFANLPYNSLATQNMATSLMAVTLMQNKLSVSEESIREGLSLAHLPGRIQTLALEPMHIFDVAHNPASVLHLTQHVKKHPISGKNIAVFSMLADKAIAESIALIQAEIDAWYVAPLAVRRAADANLLQQAFQQQKIAPNLLENIETAYAHAYQAAKKGDRLLVFGSFHTVSKALKILKARAQLSTL